MSALKNNNNHLIKKKIDRWIDNRNMLIAAYKYLKTSPYSQEVLFCWFKILTLVSADNLDGNLF